MAKKKALKKTKKRTKSKSTKPGKTRGLMALFGSVRVIDLEESIAVYACAKSTVTLTGFPCTAGGPTTMGPTGTTSPYGC